MGLLDIIIKKVKPTCERIKTNSNERTNEFKNHADVYQDSETTYMISYNKGRFLQLSSKYKLLCPLQKDNVEISKLENYKLKRQYEDGSDAYGIYIDSEEGVLIFVHQTLICIGGGCASNVEYAEIIQFDTMKALLLFELNRYKSLISKWESANDLGRANSCKEHFQMLEKIINTDSTDWRSLISI